MKTLSEKLNESLRESYPEMDEDICSLTEEIEMLYADYYPDKTFEIENSHIGNMVKRQITFPDNLNDFNSFKEAITHTVDSFNKKMKAMGQKEIAATWKGEGNIFRIELEK